MLKTIADLPPSLPSETSLPLSTPTGLLTPENAALFIGLFAIFLVIALALYIYKSLAFRTIAQKTKIPEEWTGLAWFPIADWYLLTAIAQVPWQTMFIPVGLYLAYIVFMLIPIIGIFLSAISLIGIYVWLIWLFWKVCLARNKPGWWSLLIIPVIPMVIGSAISIPIMIISSTIGMILFFISLGVSGIISLLMLGVIAWKD